MHFCPLYRRLSLSPLTGSANADTVAEKEKKKRESYWTQSDVSTSLIRSNSYGDDASPRPSPAKLMALQSERPARLCVPMLHALIAAIASFSVGVWWAWAAQTVLNASQSAAERAWSWTVLRREIPWTLYTINLGVLLGCLPVGYAVNRYGRKWTLLSTGFLHLLSWLVVLAADRRSSNLYSGRIVGGLSAAAASIAGPIYVAEISSVHERRFRGTAVVLGGVGLATGALSAHVLSPILSYGTFAALACIPPAIFILAFFNSPESPFQLAVVGRSRQAARAIRRLRGSVIDGTNLIGQRGQSLQQPEMDVDDSDAWFSWKDIILNPEVRVSALVALLGMTLPRLAGAETLLIFAAEQLPQVANPEMSWPQTSQDLIVGIYSIIVVASVISSILVDCCGRRPLIIGSCVVAALAMCSLGVYHVVVDVNFTPVSPAMRSWLVVSLFTWAGAFGLGLLSVPTLIAVEVVPTHARGLCAALAVSVAVIAASVMTGIFQVAAASADLWAVYFTFALFYVLTAAYGVFLVPEMKARPIYS